MSTLLQTINFTLYDKGTEQEDQDIVNFLRNTTVCSYIPPFFLPVLG